jgi:sporulation protein YlmC with PRC-barrel domain
MSERELRLEDLLGREVHDGDNRRVGRLEEVRAEWTDAGCAITAFVIGAAGLYERLGLGVKMIAGRRGGGRVARWDQLDLSDPNHPRLTCRLDELQAV